MRNHLNGNGVEIIDISPMGCRTGFYMSLIGTPDEQRVADAWKAAMEDVLKVQDQNQIDLFRDLKRVAQTLDSINGGEAYQKVCDELVACFDNPDLTFSARILRSMIDTGIGGTGKAFAEAYRNLLREEPLEILREEDFVAEREASERRQQEMEAADTEPFAVWLEKHA